MAAVTADDVAKLIKDNDEKVRTDINALIMEDGQALKAEMQAHRGEITMPYR